MKLLSKIFVPILISTLLLVNVGFNVIYHTCNSTGEINISFFVEENCPDEKCSKMDNSEIIEDDCCEHESKAIDLNLEKINNSNLDDCCNSETDYVQTKLDFTINYVDYDFKSDLIIGENLKLKLNDLNQDYKVILDNIDSKIKKIPTKSLSYLIEYIYSSNSNDESYLY